LVLSAWAGVPASTAPSAVSDSTNLVKDLFIVICPLIRPPVGGPGVISQRRLPGGKRWIEASAPPSALSLGPLAGLDQGEEPGRAGCEPHHGAAMTRRKARVEIVIM